MSRDIIWIDEVFDFEEKRGIIVTVAEIRAAGLLGLRGGEAVCSMRKKEK